MAVRFSATGLIADGAYPPPRGLSFVDSVLRGMGQIMLQNNSYAGLIFLIGIAYNSALMALAALVGTGVGTATALALGAKSSLVRDGLFGFNGALAAIAVIYSLQPDALTWAYLIFAAAGTTIVMAGMLRLLEVWRLPTLTAPFVLTSLCFLLACARFGRLNPTHVLPTAGLPREAIVEGIVTTSTVAEGIFNGIAQVCFQGSVITGVIFTVGLLISSRRACLGALLGSLTGLLVAWGMGAAEPAIRSGAFGFNCVLTAIAVAGVFFTLDKISAAYALLATIATAVVFAAISAALEPLGMPALTLPFVLVVWVCVLAGPLFPKLKAA